MTSASPFGLSRTQLVDLMSQRGKEREASLEDYGGVDGIADKLHTCVDVGVPDDVHELDLRRREFGANFIPPIPPKSFLALAFDAIQVSGFVWEDCD